MGNNNRSLRRLVRAVRTDPAHTEADHQLCRELLPLLVDAELLGEDISERFAPTIAHLDVCAVCNAEYAALLDMLSETETAGADSSPIRSISFSELVRNVSREVIGQMYPKLLAGLDELLEPYFDPIPVLREFEAGTAYAISDDDRNASRIVAAIHSATPIILRELAGEGIDRLIDDNGLGPLIYSQAEKQALLIGIDEVTASLFAKNYAAAMEREKSWLRRWVAKGTR